MHIIRKDAYDVKSERISWYICKMDGFETILHSSNDGEIIRL